jgi:hypothetical protein
MAFAAARPTECAVEPGSRPVVHNRLAGNRIRNTGAVANRALHPLPALVNHGRTLCVEQ